MSESSKFECKDPAGHAMHICQLRAQGRQQEVNVLMANPGHTCLNCNAVAKEFQHLCNPSSFSRV